MRLLCLAFCLASIPGIASAQAAEPPGRPARPLELLLQYRESLDLTSDQLERLDQVRGRLAAANDPLVGRMMALRTEWRRARRASRDDEAAEPRLRRIRAAAEQARLRIQRNQRSAMRAVNRILTPVQRRQLALLVDARRTRETDLNTSGGADADGRP